MKMKKGGGETLLYPCPRRENDGKEFGLWQGPGTQDGKVAKSGDLPTNEKKQLPAGTFAKGSSQHTEIGASLAACIR